MFGVTVHNDDEYYVDDADVGGLVDDDIDNDNDDGCSMDGGVDDDDVDIDATNTQL